MALLRALLLLFAIALCVCVALYFVTGERKYLRWAGSLLKIAVATGLLFFAVLLLERLT